MKRDLEMPWKFIGCEIIYREACHLASRSPRRIDVSFLPKGLHDLETAQMVARVQQAVDEVGSEYAAVLLGYARCNDGLVGVEARDVPLVLPRAHDCITFFFGGRQAYQEYFDACPGTYYMTTGWYERGGASSLQGDQLGPGHNQLQGTGLTDSYAQLVAKYGEENAAYIAETLGGWKHNYKKMLYLTMGLIDETPMMEATSLAAQENGWSFEQRPGQWRLLEDLFAGRWEEDFLVVRPGQKVVARNDGRIVDAQDAQG